MYVRLAPQCYSICLVYLLFRYVVIIVVVIAIFKPIARNFYWGFLLYKMWTFYLKCAPTEPPGYMGLILYYLKMQLTLHSIHPEKMIYIQESFAVHKDKSLCEATQEAHKVRCYTILSGNIMQLYT